MIRSLSFLTCATAIILLTLGCTTPGERPSSENESPVPKPPVAYEQKVETPDKNFQYLLFACDPYETIAFKIPNQPIDKKEGKFYTSWDARSKKFVLTLFFLDGVTVR